MAVYHLNPQGNPGRCKAELDNCPFGSPDEHYITKKAAITAFELQQSGSFEGSAKRDLARYQLDEADAKLLHHALKLATATPEQRARIETKTDAIAIVRAVQVDQLISISR